MLLSLSLGLTLAAPPQFEVRNTLPPSFVVVNTLPVEVPLVIADPRHPAPPGYEWQRWPGEDWKLVKLTAAPGVAAPTFRQAGGHNPGHNCPSCGRGQYYVSGRGPTPGSHTHTCPGCGTSWWH